MQPYKQLLPPAAEGIRIDRYLSDLTGRPRSAVQRLCAQGLVLVDGKPAAKNHRLHAGACLEYHLPPEQPAQLLAQPIPLDIVYEDEALLVVNKPKGLVVHPAPGNESGTLANALLHHCGQALLAVGDPMRPGIVHRLDKDTSGLLVVAKTPPAHEHLTQQMAAHSVTRRYHAVVYGGFRELSGRVEAPIGRSTADRKRMCVTTVRGRPAATRYTVLEQLTGFSHLQLELETGRTHQIRVHMAHIGHPVAGDPVYGPKKKIASLQGQCLHAAVIGFLHPQNGRYVEFSSELPAYFQGFLQKITP